MADDFVDYQEAKLFARKDYVMSDQGLLAQDYSLTSNKEYI